ncbi:MAG: pilus assembly protein PilM [Clostridia bacterium]|nr:pilus assembly protein PilM [Clostridia bacterium]
MAKNILGIDIGYDSLKLALVNGTTVKKTYSVPMPKKLLQEGRVVSTETMGELIRGSMRKGGISANYAALSLSGESVFIRTLTVPQMTPDQLNYNIGYEFRDYITTELKDCVFDYAMISTPEQLRSQTETVDESGNRVAPTMDILAVAAPVKLIEDSKAMLRKAGLRLAKAAPSECAYIALIREAEKRGAEKDREYCILDLGYNAIRMHMFRGERHMVTRQLEVGLSSIDDVIADTYNVDVHLAHTYLLSNHDGCQDKDVCVSAFGNISVELMRAINFYRFNNPESSLSDIWLCGGGVAIPSLRNSIAESLDLNLHPAEELVSGGDRIADCFEFVQAIGIAQY